MKNLNWLSKENEIWRKGFKHIAGVDEAGRGPLAGPVVCAAVVLKPGVDLPGIIDSKEMPESDREEGYNLITCNCLSCTVYAASASMIDRINILKATLSAMQRAVLRLDIKADYVLIDGNHYPKNLQIPTETVIGGDGCSRSIAAASVLAKVTRDRLMRNLDKIYPEYGFARNKGYATTDHIKAIRKHGPTPHHRFSFQPVRQFNLPFDDGK